MTIIQEYALSKNIYLPDNENLNDFEIVLECLKNEYGFIAPIFDGMSKAEIITLNINVDNFVLHHAYLKTIDERKPEQPEIIGIIVQHEDKYRLIDGHHRFIWALNNREKANFILVS